ncbi:flagellar basal body P-ring formation chaperone FlgA [Bdellovibrio bacteriovorus]|uniref:flagellar basal body P-ring formation chaperone FlgA n=1 Tax=Bdellovibrio bacteriovorus TaxID=959 RepID=UPI0021D02BDD|nr:flagellar basal body P-ring formation chaperone FlgA [Bdellovibrio bacteriovorus]UXR64927.1 flagellar basal body P-ring formation chaperone FlgA [Bdellovibrio bacteriovorus]
MIKYFMFLLLVSTQAFARPEISIPASVEISQRELLRLGDIATVEGGSEELLAALDAVVLREDARELLLSQHLESGEILGRMRSALNSQENLRRMNPQFKVPSQVKVSFASTPVSKQEIERKIHNVLKARCQECEYQVSVQSTPRPASKLWDLDYTQLSAKGGFLLPLRDGDQRQIKWISGTIRVSRLTPVTTRLILQGERVQADDLRMSMTDVTFAKDGSLRMEDIQGQLAARSLPVGSTVWASDLKREPAAKKGQVVKALLGDDSFEISVNMMAEDSGFVGDIIKVKNLETQKVLSGLVTEKGVVKLQ